MPLARNQHNRRRRLALLPWLLRKAGDKREDNDALEDSAIRILPCNEQPDPMYEGYGY